MSSFCATPPHLWASLTDVMTASQLVEDAIHAPTVATTSAFLLEANKNLGYALNYLTSAGTYPGLIAKVNNTISLLTQLRSMITPSADLATLQKGYIYNFMGCLSDLYMALWMAWMGTMGQMPGPQPQPRPVPQPGPQPGPTPWPSPYRPYGGHQVRRYKKNDSDSDSHKDGRHGKSHVGHGRGKK